MLLKPALRAKPAEDNGFSYEQFKKQNFVDRWWILRIIKYIFAVLAEPQAGFLSRPRNLKSAP